ncbi:DNA endonuclease RBBP8-like [Oppia nitens]|uniref:DNA endonuclease RBBP8-like n=1 Tax=Oppia nitens TaxID=1686743 RepID=UPI0023DC86EA|nr:DNA endonuclease RBBP8-like [Oppia nitens]
MGKLVTINDENSRGGSATAMATAAAAGNGQQKLVVPIKLVDRRKTSPVKLKMKTLGPTVRERSKRRQLNGYSCKECEDYYKTRQLSDGQLRNRLNECSRHRQEYSPPKSPEHFWETHIPTTPELIRRGVFNVEDKRLVGVKTTTTTTEKNKKKKTWKCLENELSQSSSSTTTTTSEQEIVVLSD